MIKFKTDSFLYKLFKKYNILQKHRRTQKIFNNGSLEDYQKWDTLKVLDTIHEYFNNPRKIVCLDIGTSAPEAITIAKYVRKVVGINISGNYLKTTKCPGNVELKVMDGTNLVYPDNSFDFVYSINLFEHIQNLDKCIDEQMRVVKPGGYCYATWYPAWSSAKGHHVMEDMVSEWERDLFVEKQGYRNDGSYISDWSHLYLSKSEMKNSLFQTIGNEKLVNHIVGFIYDSDELNRVFFDDVLEILESKNLKIDKLIKTEEIVPEGITKRLKSVYPFNDFSTSGCQVVFQKSKK